jgi:hypothetical protein
MTHRTLPALVALPFMFAGRFTFVLVVLLLLLALFPFLEATERSYVFLRVLFSLLLFSAFLISSGPLWTITVGLLLFLPALIVHWVNFAVTSFALAVLDGCLAVAVYSVLAATILDAIFRTRKVTYETIGGALCVYLLLGLFGAAVCALMELLQPGSFRLVEPVGENDGHFVFGDRGYAQFVYYSFATLTTLGMGDIIPLTNPARTFSYLEAVAGQFYLAVMVARLVGLHIAQPGVEHPGS